MYKASKYINQIRKCGSKETDFTWNMNYAFFDTYEEAKRYLINRTELKIINLERELNELRKSLPKLIAMQELF